MSAFFLLIISAFFHAFWNAIIKKVQDKDIFLFSCMLISYILAGLLGYFVEGLRFPTTAGLLWSLGAGVFEGGYFMTLSASLKRSSLGQAYAIQRGGAMLIVWLISAKFLGEGMSLIAFVGVALVFLGLTLNQKASLSINYSFRDSIWPYLCAVFIAGYHLCYDQAMHAGTGPLSSFSAAMVFALPFLYFQARNNMGRRLKEVIAQHPYSIGAAGVLATASFGIFLIGLHGSAAGYAITLRNTSILFATVFSIILGDKMTKWQLAGIGLIFLGAVSLGFA